MNVIPDDDWNAWVEKHSRVFGLQTDEDLQMVDSWREAFELHGYTAGELNAATTWLTLHSPPTWRTQHLDRINGRIQDERRRRCIAQAQERDAAIEANVCRECRSTALVIVPHLSFVRDGEWIAPFYDFAVACNCRKGALLYETLRAEAAGDEKRRAKAIMSIGDYEMRNPNWRRQVAARRMAAEAQSRAAGAASAADKSLGKILAGIGAMP